jgi:hypothetical protein
MTVTTTTTTIDDRNEKEDTSSLSSSSSSSRDLNRGGGGSSGGSSTYAVLSRKLAISYIRDYNRCVYSAIMEKDLSAVRVMVGWRDRSIIGDIFAVARYLSEKNVGGISCIDAILSLCNDEDEKKKLYRKITCNAARHGNMDLVIEMLDRDIHAINLSEIASSAARGGHKYIVMDMIRRGADNYDWIAYEAARGGHKDIVLDMIRRGANNYDWIANSAARGGHVDLVLEMIRRGHVSDEWSEIVSEAFESFADRCLDMEVILKRAHDYNWIAYEAAISEGHKDLVKHVARRRSSSRGSDDST